MNYAMTMGFGIRTLLCVTIAGAFLYLYIEKKNDLTALRIAIPAVSQELKGIREENARLKYEIDKFESPSHLLELSRQPEYAHLKHPYTHEVWSLPSSMPLQ